MVRYFYTWTPLVIVGAVVFLALPWLGVIALLVASLAMVAAVAGAFVVVPYRVGRAVGRRVHSATHARVQTASAQVPALSPARRQIAWLPIRTFDGEEFDATL